MTKSIRLFARSVLRTTASRLMQFAGNLLKIFLYLHFRLMPRVRLSIPDKSAPC